MRDDFDPVVADRIKVLDDMSVPDTWSRVLERMPALDPGSPAWKAEDVATMGDLEISTPTDPRRKVPMRILAATLAAAVIAIAIALVVVRDHDATPAHQPLPFVTVPQTGPPRPLPKPGPSLEQLAPGTYYVDEVDGTPTLRIFATLGAGWRDGFSAEGWELEKSDADPDQQLAADEFQQHQIGYMTFSNPDAVYSDACHWEDGFYPGPVDTVDGLVAALTEQQGWAEVTEPSDISVDGYIGKAFQRTAPAVMSDCTTIIGRTRVSDGPVPHADFRSWENVDGGGSLGDVFHEPGEIETLWVLDIDGTIVVISTGLWPEPSAGADADFAADVLDSIRIDRP